VGAGALSDGILDVPLLVRLIHLQLYLLLAELPRLGGGG
jgi:hypothetical protein